MISLHPRPANSAISDNSPNAHRASHFKLGPGGVDGLLVEPTGPADDVDGVLAGQTLVVLSTGHGAVLLVDVHVAFRLKVIIGCVIV